MLYNIQNTCGLAGVTVFDTTIEYYIFVQNNREKNPSKHSQIVITEQHKVRSVNDDNYHVMVFPKGYL